MPTISIPTTTQPSSRKKRRLRRTLLVALAAAAALTAPTVGAAARGGASPPLRDQQLLIAIGKGKVTGELPFCFNGAPGPCGWIIQGSHKGSPIRSGTFFAAIDDGGAASPRRCVPASLSGLLYETADDAITQVGEGQVCPNGAGGHVFTGRVDIAGVSGRFQDISSGRGRVWVSIAKNGSATLTLTGHISVG